MAAVIEVEAFVADRQRPDLPMAWDVVVETRHGGGRGGGPRGSPHRAIGIEAAVVVDTTGVEVEATGNGTISKSHGVEETATVVGVDTNKHYGLSLMYYLFCLFTIRLLVYPAPPHGPKRRSAVPPSIAARSFVVLNP
jgi:hypothetical protein